MHSVVKAYERTTVFNPDGVRTQVAETEAEYERFLDQGWLMMPAPPPPEPEPPMSPEERATVTASELEGLGDQVDAQAGLIASLEDRVSKIDTQGIENISRRMERVEELYRPRKDARDLVHEGLMKAVERISKLEDALANATTAFEQVENRLASLEKRKKE